MKKITAYLSIIALLLFSFATYAANVKPQKKKFKKTAAEKHSKQKSHATRHPKDPALHSNSLYDAVMHGKIWLNFRLRYEHVNIDTPKLKDANALTLKSVLGYQTDYFHGFWALLEFENVSILGLNDFNSGGGTTPSKAGFAPVVDPKGTEVNQAFIGYHGIPKTEIKLGRQRINLDNQRFVGGVAFRQNEQTYDAASIATSYLPYTEIYYAYVGRVNRIFGPRAKTPFDHWSAQSHFVNINYHGFKYFDIIPYAYIIKNTNNDITSNNTYGIRLHGAATTHDNFKFLYTAEFAHQTDGSGNPTDYSANYYHIMAGMAHDGFSFKLGDEILGGDNSVPKNQLSKAFRTPYATLHKFNGWADVFLNTPKAGLDDKYASVAAKIKPLGNIKLIGVLHHFSAESGNEHYGNELDFGVYKTFHKHYGISVEYGNFSADSNKFKDVQKVWVSLMAKFA